MCEHFMNNISTCIIGRGIERDLRNTLAVAKKISDDVLIVNSSRSSLPQDLLDEGRYTLIDFSPASDLPEIITRGVMEATQDWVLILEAGEEISARDCAQIAELCSTSDGDAYQVLYPRKLESSILSEYEWLGSQIQINDTNTEGNVYVPILGVRFFKKDVFQRVESFHNGLLKIEFKKAVHSVRPSGIKIKTLIDDKRSHSLLAEQELWKRDWDTFIKKIPAPARLPRSGELIGPGDICFPIISEEDLPSLEKGMELGFGRIDILKWEIHHLIEKSAYKKAIDLSERVIQNMPPCPEIYEIWHMMGIAAFHQLDLERAANDMGKALEFNESDRTTLFDLVRVHIVSGNFVLAREILDRAIACHGCSPENEYIHQAINRKRIRQTKMSCLLLCRDEQRYIGRALQSILPVAEEIVAVDTGSTDQTRELLLEHGAKVVDFPWTDDFAEARNYGLTKITGDFVFWMDADEYLTDKDRLSLLVFKNLLVPDEPVGVVFNVHTIDGDYGIEAKGIPPLRIDKRTALFPNSPRIRFQGGIFESVDASLQALRIPLLFAESVSIRHHHDDAMARRLRKMGAMSRIEESNLAHFFRGIQFWLEVGETGRAGDWFERAIGTADGDVRYLTFICMLFDEFKNKGLIRSHPRIFGNLLAHYGAYYRVTTLLADYLCALGEFASAIPLLRRLAAGEDLRFADKPEAEVIQKNLINMALASLECNDMTACNAVLERLTREDGMTDAVRALSFYRAVRLRDLEQAIVILDQWISERNLPIQGTINNFTEFLQIVAQCADVINKYGAIDATRILMRAAAYFAETIRDVS
jgi:glycosyltransferase involved in cell wall biosynthesis